jgi:N-methylhydantoinase A
MLRIGIDIGGTFTDFVVYDPKKGSITTFKQLTDIANPANTILNGLKNGLVDQPAQIIHGSTIATNALLERKGARTALITTSGIRDVIQIGRQNRPDIYDWNLAPSPVLVPSDLRFEVEERINSHGDVITPLNIAQVDDLSKYLSQYNIEAVAVCLLFSFLHPQHEQMIVERVRNWGYFVSASSEILPEYREYERTSTTVVNAYVSPTLDRYLTTLQNSLPISNLQIMQSNGGMINLSEARQNGVRCILSGPAGGIVGASHISKSIIADNKWSGEDQKLKIITFDMGGTSTDVSLINGTPSLTTDAVIGGCPIHLPLLDIHTIGAGGGSIAYVDQGGLLLVGPHSSGADPGPACYGKGDLPTVTDANLVLGRILPEYFLGGQMHLYPERAYSAMLKLGQKVNLTPIQTAFGVIDVVNIQMERALRVISVERGHDPREFSLFSFGGAGGLHAADLARNLGIPRVIISKYASTLSAFGMLVSNVIKDYVQTLMLPGTSPKRQLDNCFSSLVKKGINDIEDQGFLEDQIEIQLSLDVRYAGQSFELNIPYSDNFIEVFHETHALIYGYSYSDKSIEIVNIRTRAIGRISPVFLPQISKASDNSKPSPERSIRIETREGPDTIPIYKYDQLSPGMKLQGPALIISNDTTILINQSDLVTVDKYQNLLIDINISE